MDNIKLYLKQRLKDLGKMLADYEDYRDSMQKDEDTSHYDKLVLIGRARILELKRFEKYHDTRRTGIRYRKKIKEEV